MPTISDNAVCIRRWDFSETSQTVGLFTREHGVLRGLAKGAKREKGAFSGGFDVLTRGQIVAIIKPGRDLVTLTQWSLEEVFWSIRRHLAANRAGLYMADLIYHMAGEADPHPMLFDAFVASLRDLEQQDRIATALLKFQWIALCETGYKPDLVGSQSTRGDSSTSDIILFSPSSGGVVAHGTGKTWRVRRETIELLQRVREDDKDESLHGAENAASVDRANRLLASYIREILGSQTPTLAWAFPDLPS